MPLNSTQNNKQTKLFAYLLAVAALPIRPLNSSAKGLLFDLPKSWKLKA